MKARISVLPLFLAVCVVPGRAQAVTPSITIETHVLTLGMPESTVLEQLGNDLTLKHLPPGTKPNFPQGALSNRLNSSWLVERKTNENFVLLGSVSFTAHKLSSVNRNWEIQATSAKSLFYAISAASKSLEQEGFANCRLSTNDQNYSLNNGSLASTSVKVDCGMKGMTITSNLSDAPDVDSNVDVDEWMHGTANK